MSLFIIELSYRAPLDQIDGRMRAHMQFLRRQYAAGRFLVSGRKVPRDGGIILAIGEDRETVDALAREDPFVREGLADYRLIEFRASQKADDITTLLDRA